MNEKYRPIKYYLNTSFIDKLPRKAPKKAWQKFHSSWVPVDNTPHGLASNIWRGYSFAAVHDGAKRRDNFQEAWHIALDFDCEDKRASIDHLKRNDFISYFASFAYYTPSSDPPKYKSRVVFVFDRPITDPDYYELALEAMAWYFPDSDQSCTDAARFFFGSKGAELWGNWSIMPLKNDDYDGPLEYLIQEYQKEKPAPAPKPVYTGTTDQKQVIEALKRIPKHLDYTDWLRVLMAIESEYPGADGVAMCESWAPGYDGEIADKFKSFKRKGGKLVSLGSLFEIAKRYGYTPPAKYEKMKFKTHAERLQAINDYRR